MKNRIKIIIVSMIAIIYIGSVASAPTNSYANLQIRSADASSDIAERTLDRRGPPPPKPSPSAHPKPQAQSSSNSGNEEQSHSYPDLDTFSNDKPIHGGDDDLAFQPLPPMDMPETQLNEKPWNARPNSHLGRPNRPISSNSNSWGNSNADNWNSNADNWNSNTDDNIATRPKSWQQLSPNAQFNYMTRVTKMSGDIIKTIDGFLDAIRRAGKNQSRKQDAVNRLSNYVDEVDKQMKTLDFSAAGPLNYGWVKERMAKARNVLGRSKPKAQIIRNYRG
ncbi:hypothetical protein HDU97_006495 [Phlyctochytrium planicorne]|nr:hypothetical protein HDU97_006495 [Phlyctochytrium planicorne]